MEQFNLVENILGNKEILFTGTFEECLNLLESKFDIYSGDDFYTIENKTDLWFTFRMPSGTKGFVKIEPYGKN